MTGRKEEKAMKKLLSIISLVLTISNNAAGAAAHDVQAAAVKAAARCPRIVCTMQAKEKALPAAPAEYRRMTTVYSLEPADDAVIVVDSDGELWEFYGVEDWAVGDWCELTMIDTGKPGYKWDDEITRTIYKGTNESFE